MEEWCSSWSKWIEPVPLPDRDWNVDTMKDTPAFKKWAEKPRYAFFAPFINILGGEPTLHRDLKDVLKMTRRYWPNAHIRLTCTGFQLHKHPNLDKVLYDNDVVLKITIHSQSKEYLAAYSEPLKLARKWQKKGVKVDWAELYAEGWEIIHKVDEDGIIHPHAEGDAKKSWTACDIKSYQIYENMIWKCPSIAYIYTLKKTHPEVVSPEYDKYMEAYKPLSLDASYQEKHDFFWEQEEVPFCEICPQVVEYVPREQLPCPLRNAEAYIPSDDLDVVNLDEVVVEYSQEKWKNQKNPQHGVRSRLATDHDVYKYRIGNDQNQPYKPHVFYKKKEDIPKK